ncbi:MAG: hypothetical protein LBR80_16635 [Deltaproteobacteria bacterium]|nr:hypothetical protein [Deltaproteobacteria bacterium]
MQKTIASRMMTMEESIHELDRRFARVILELEHRVRALCRTGQDAVPGPCPVPFASSALAAIVLPGPRPI